MSTYNLGRILPIYRGVYEVGTTYNKLDIVYVQGFGSYVAKQTVASVQPQTNPEIWQIVAADCTNQELEETFNVNEANREQRVNNFISQKSQELSTLIDEVNSEVDAKLSEVDSALDGIEGEWETMKNTMNNQFNSAQTERESTFETNEEQRESTLQNAISTLEAQDTTFKNSLQNETSEWLNEKTVEFNEAQTERATEFNDSMTSMNGQFNAAQSNRTTTFNNSESDRATTFTTNETARQTTFETNEDSRQNEFDSKEADRDEATQAIINEHDYLVNLDNTKANKDGYYSTLTAGAAENLVGDSVDSDTYLIRPTGGENNEVANGVASVVELDGESYVWNQLIQNGDFSNGTTGWSGISTVVDNTATIFRTATGSEFTMTLSHAWTPQVNHKYFISASVKSNNSTTTIGFVPTGTVSDYVSGYALYLDWTTVQLIITLNTVNGSNFHIRGRNNTDPNTDINFSAKNVQIIDLTLLGIDNLTTTHQVEAWLAQHVGTKPYYDYNKGTILSAKTTGFKTYGQNLLNPTTRQAKLIPYTWEDNSNVYTLKNVPSGATATFTPDNNGVAETVDLSGGSLDITNYGSGVLELSSATDTTYVCMKWDGTKDDDVVPYEDHTYDFDVRKVYGKVNGEGEYIQCFPDGMKSAITVHDTLTVDKAVVKIKTIDLGAVTWDYIVPESGNPYFRRAIPDRKIELLRINYICSKYQSVLPIDTSVISTNLNNKCIAGRLSSAAVQMFIRDDSYTTRESFMNAVSGEKLSYELATPITYTDLIYSEDGGQTGTPLSDSLLQIDVDNWSIEEQIVDVNSLPAKVNTIYGINAVEALDTLSKSTYTESEIHSNFAALLSCINTNCSTVLGGTFSVSDTATDKVFTFTFTQNEEGEGQ